jgi:DNA-directed RNA polymerase sigma subunit (sigma70/sigma32)
MRGFLLSPAPQGASLPQRGGPASTGRVGSWEPRERGARLSAERERELVVATEGGDERACRQLVDSFLPAIGGVARRFGAGGGVQRAELMQEGIAGLLYAAKRYDPRMETPFWGYASFWVRKAMQELVAEVTRPMALSDHAVRGLAKVKAARRDLLDASGAEPTEEELAAATGFTRSKLDSLLAIDRTPRSFEEPLGADGGTTAFGEMVADPGGGAGVRARGRHDGGPGGAASRRPARRARAHGVTGPLRFRPAPANV